MNGPFKLSTPDWCTVRLEDAFGVGVTGVAYNSGLLAFKIAKNGAAATTKTLASAAEWQEQSNGFYWVKLTAPDLDTLGAGSLIPIYNSIEQMAVPFRVNTGDLDKVLGLNDHNTVRDQMVYSGTDLTSARIRSYDTAANATSAGATGLLQTWTMTATYSSPGVLSTYKIVAS